MIETYPDHAMWQKVIRRPSEQLDPTLIPSKKMLATEQSDGQHTGVQEQAGLTEGQVEELVAVWQKYISCTHRILLQRQVLWQAMRASLQLTSLQDEQPSAESKIQAFQKALELRRNMNDYHSNFTLLMREWLLRILAPFQVPPPPPRPRVCLPASCSLPVTDCQQHLFPE